VINNPQMVFTEGDINQIEIILRREIAKCRDTNSRLSAKKLNAQNALSEHSDHKIAVRLAGQLAKF